MAPRALMLLAFTLSGLLMIVLSVPLIQRRVPPNRWYGLRTPRTLGDRRVWFPANEYAGWRLLGLGAWLALGANLLYYVPFLSDSEYALATATALLLALGVMLLRIIRFLHRLEDEATGRQFSDRERE